MTPINDLGKLKTGVRLFLECVCQNVFGVHDNIRTIRLLWVL